MTIEEFNSLRVGDAVMYGGEINTVTYVQTGSFVMLEDEENYSVTVYYDEKEKISIMEITETPDAKAKFLKDFDYWLGLNFSDGANVSAKDRANYLTELKKRFYDVSKDNMSLRFLKNQLKEDGKRLEEENKKLRELNAELTEENNRLTGGKK